MTAQPQTRVGELLKELNALVESGDTLDEFSARRYKHEARKLMDIELADGHTLKAIVAFLQREIDKMRYHHLEAIRYDTSVFSRYAYATSLQNLGFLGEALDQYQMIMDTDRLNLKFLDDAIKASIMGCCFKMAGDLTEKWQQLNPGQLHPQAPLACKLIEVMDEHGIEDADLLPIAETFCQQMRELGNYRASQNVHYYQNIEPRIRYAWHLKMDAKETAYINLEVIDRLIAEHDNLFSDVIIFSCLPAQTENAVVKAVQ